MIVGRRHWSIDMAILNSRCPIPLPFLYGHEHARLRLLQHTFRTKGHHLVADTITRVLQFRFNNPEVISNFLFSGLLDARETFPEALYKRATEQWLASPPGASITTDKARFDFFSHLSLRLSRMLSAACQSEPS